MGWTEVLVRPDTPETMEPEEPDIREGVCPEVREARGMDSAAGGPAGDIMPK